MENNSQVSAVNILWTKDYSQFHFLKGNRDLNNAKINRIIKSVQGGLEFFRYCPIMVNQQIYIIDGQHRFYVCKKLNLNIYYVVVPNFSLRQIAEINNNTSRWKDSDFLNCYVDCQNKDYKQLHSFCEIYHLNLIHAAGLLNFGTIPTGDKIHEIFRNGDFKVQYADKATSFMEKASDFKPFHENHLTRSFLRALETLFNSEKYSHQEMIDKLTRHNLKISQRSTPKEYLVHLEELYNYKNSKRYTIY